MSEYLSSIRHSRETAAETDLSNPRYRLLIFDFHGTLADRQLWPLRALSRSWTETFGTRPPKNVCANALFRGEQSYAQYISNVLAENQQTVDILKTQELLKRFNGIMKHTYVPTPGMINVIKKFTGAGIYSAILTNSPKTQDVQDEIVRWGLPELSQHIFNGPLMGVKKPNPQAVTHVVEAYHSQDDTITQENVLLIGDHFDDTNAALHAQVDCVLMIRPNVSREIRIKSPHPSYIIDNPFDLVEIVAGKRQPLQKADHTVSINAPFFNRQTL